MAGWLERTRAKFRDAMSVPQEDAATRIARALQGGTLPDDQPPGLFGLPPGWTTPPWIQPGRQGTPPYMQNGDMPAWQGEGDTAAAAPPAASPVMVQATPPVMPPVTAQATPMPPQAPETPAAVPDLPPPVQVGALPDVQAAIAQLIQQKRLLPDQWKGAFSNQYGEPG